MAVEEVYQALLGLGVHGCQLILAALCVAICVYVFQELRDLGDARANPYDAVPTMNRVLALEPLLAAVLFVLGAASGQWLFVAGMLPLGAYHAHALATKQQQLSVVDVNQFDVRDRAHKVTAVRMALYGVLAFCALYLLAYDVVSLLRRAPLKIRVWRLTQRIF